MANGPYYPEAEYLCRTVAAELCKARTGTTQYAITFEVLGQIDPNDPEGALIECTKYERTMFMAITDKTVDFVIEKLRKIGFEGNSFRELQDADMTGREVTLYCKHETYEGKNREKWDVSKGATKREPLESKDLRELDNLFGKSFKLTPASKPAAKQQPANGNRLPTQADNIDTMNKVLSETAHVASGTDDIPF